MTDTIRMTNKARDAAKSLAVRYAAYTEWCMALAKDYSPENAERFITWAKMLRNVQRETGIEMVNESTLARRIDQCERLIRSAA